MSGFSPLSKPQLFDVACERATLGAALTYNALLDELTDALFYDGESRAILAVAKAVREEGREADIVSVMAYSTAHNSGLNPITLTELFTNADPVSAFSQNVERLRLLVARRKAQTVAYLIESIATNEAVDLSDTLEKAQEQIAEIQQTAQPKTDAYFIDMDHRSPSPDYLLEYDGVKVMPLRNIHGVVARRKMGKSHLNVIFMAAVLGCSDFGFKCLVPDASVLFVDTEQDSSDTEELTSKVHTLIGWQTDKNSPRLKVACLRDMLPKDRLPFIMSQTRKFRPVLLVVDGIVDLLPSGDFNDPHESNDVIQALMRLSMKCNCAIICVLHLNEGKDSDKARGHIGSFLVQKSCDVFGIEKNNDTAIFNVKHIVHRHRQMSDFAFGLDGHGVPMRAQSMAEAKAEANTAALSKLVREAFGQDRELSYTELCDRIAAYGGVSLPTAKRRLKSAREFGIISVLPETNKYTL